MTLDYEKMDFKAVPAMAVVERNVMVLNNGCVEIDQT